MMEEWNDVFRKEVLRCRAEGSFMNNRAALTHFNALRARLILAPEGGRQPDQHGSDHGIFFERIIVGPDWSGV